MMMSSETTILDEKPALCERFELVETLGEGAAGIVYRVRDRKNNGIEVALKVLTDSSAFDEHTLERFKEEIIVCQQIRHPNIVQAYDFIELEDTLAFTMEYVKGYDLGVHFIERKIGYEEIDKIFGQLLSALDKLHSNGIVHRDIKLENILVREDGTIKLSDLGLMKRLDVKGLTRTGIILGTAQYLPPEYIKATKYDERGDIYSAGVLLFELLTRQRRLADKPGMQAIEHLVKTKFEIPRMTLTGLPVKYVQIIEKAMHVKPSRRYQSAVKMKDAFDMPLSGDPQAVVEVDEKLKLSDYAAVKSALSEIWIKPSYKSLFKKIIVVLVIVIVTLVAYLTSVYTSHSLDLADGKYTGNVFIDKSTQSTIEVRVDQRGIFLSTELTGCTSGYVSNFSREIGCQRKGLQFVVDSVQAGEYVGKIIDTRADQTMPFTISEVKDKAIKG